ncbi:MAG: triose-phosphate isomerase [Candidatus Methylacidiphilales bacterium]|nr:triose-phosphate isomerase [Candidatus Methylacidiphilales bacterium]
MAFARKKIIAGNWKMNKTATEARQLVSDIIEKLGKFAKADVVLCPPFTAIAVTHEIVGNHTAIALGAQNMHEKASGAYTGEISAAMLRDLFVRYVILGHSERRQFFGETDALINTKALAALQNHLRPIICVGETLEQREAGQTSTVVETQVRGSCANITEEQWDDAVIAYEPVWAIGTGKTASPAQAQEVHAHIRKVLQDMAGDKVASKVRIQYGGSVKADNAQELLTQEDIDGALVGGASLDAESFVTIITAPFTED